AREKLPSSAITRKYRSWRNSTIRKTYSDPIDIVLANMVGANPKYQPRHCYLRNMSMPVYRSRTSTAGRNMAGARALSRCTGMIEGDFGKPLSAVANSCAEFVPGHVHLRDVGRLVIEEIEQAGGVGKEFNTIAVDDGIAMGHDGMLYSLPSREIIADSV